MGRMKETLGFRAAPKTEKESILLEHYEKQIKEEIKTNDVNFYVYEGKRLL